MKKFISFLMAFVLCMTFAVPVFAVSDACGKYYQNLTWRVDGTTLYIEGSGEMTKYKYHGKIVPWWDYHDTITTLVLPAGITYISDYAFCYFTKLEEVFIPSNNVTLGYESFYGCSSLKRLAIGTPEGTTEDSIHIGPESFENCENLSDVFISRSLKKIDYDGFEQCYALNNFYYGGVVQDYEKNVTVDMGSDNGNQYLTEANRKYRYEIWNNWCYNKEQSWVEPGIDWPFSDAPFNFQKIEFFTFKHFENDGKTYWNHMPDGTRANEAPIVYTYDDKSYSATIPDGTVIIGNFTEWKSDGLTHWHELPNGEKVHFAFHTTGGDTCPVCGEKIYVTYRNQNKEIVESSDVAWINDQTTSITGGKFVVFGKVALPSRLEVTGDCTIILTDGCELNANGGIHVLGGRTLTICALSTNADKMGSIITTTAPEGQAGIGSGIWEKNSHIIICGGRIEAFGGKFAAGIGSGECGSTTVDIYNGIIEATGGLRGSGIGSGNTYNGQSDCFVNIHNGNVKAWGGSEAAGIGGGSQSSFKVNIYNGMVEAWGNSWGSGIGSGYNPPSGSVYISESAKASVIGHGGPGCSDINSLQDTPVTASTISEGNIWIIAGIGAVAVVAIVVIAAKKKKKIA